MILSCLLSCSQPFTEFHFLSSFNFCALFFCRTRVFIISGTISIIIIVFKLYHHHYTIYRGRLFFTLKLACPHFASTTPFPYAWYYAFFHVHLSYSMPSCVCYYFHFKPASSISFAFFSNLSFYLSGCFPPTSTYFISAAAVYRYLSGLCRFYFFCLFGILAKTPQRHDTITISSASFFRSFSLSICISSRSQFCASSTFARIAYFSVTSVYFVSFRSSLAMSHLYIVFRLLVFTCRVAFTHSLKVIDQGVGSLPSRPVCAALALR